MVCLLPRLLSIVADFCHELFVLWQKGANPKTPQSSIFAHFVCVSLWRSLYMSVSEVSCEGDSCFNTHYECIMHLYNNENIIWPILVHKYLILIVWWDRARESNTSVFRLWPAFSSNKDVAIENQTTISDLNRKDLGDIEKNAGFTPSHWCLV